MKEWAENVNWADHLGYKIKHRGKWYTIADVERDDSQTFIDTAERTKIVLDHGTDVEIAEPD